MKLQKHFTSHLRHLYGQEEGSEPATGGESSHVPEQKTFPGELPDEGLGVRWQVSKG